MERITEVADGCVKSFGLTEETHNIAVKMISEGKTKFGNYELKEPDREVVNVWISEAHSNGEADYAEFLRKALAEDADLYTLYDSIGDFEQPLGEVVVY